MLVDQSTTQRRAARTIAVYIHRPNHFCTHNPRVPPHQLAQLAHAQFRPTAATPNRNEQLGLYKNCVIMGAHNASQ